MGLLHPPSRYTKLELKQRTMIIFDNPAADALAATVAATLNTDVADLEEQLAVLAYDEVDLEADDAAEQLRELWLATQAQVEAGELSPYWYN